MVQQYNNIIMGIVINKNKNKQEIMTTESSVNHYFIKERNSFFAISPDPCGSSVPIGWWDGICMCLSTSPSCCTVHITVDITVLRAV